MNTGIFGGAAGIFGTSIFGNPTGEFEKSRTAHTVQPVVGTMPSRVPVTAVAKSTIPIAGLGYLPPFARGLQPGLHIYGSGGTMTLPVARMAPPTYLPITAQAPGVQKPIPFLGFGSADSIFAIR